MKTTIKHYFPLVLTVLCTVFSIGFLFYGITNLSQTFSNYTPKDSITYVAKEVESQPKAPLPTLKYMGNSLTAGDAIAFDRLFLLQFSDGTHAFPKEVEHTSIYLLDVTSANGTSVLTKLSSADISSLSEFPSAAIYDTQKHLLYFRNSGNYTLSIRFYYDYRFGILYECQVPVEAR